MLWFPVEVPALDGVVVVVVVGVDEADGLLAVEEDSLVSSCTSLASSEFSVDSAEETDSLSDVVSSVPSDSPAVTCCPTAAVTVATWPPTWNEAEASLTGSTVPTTVRLCPISARATVARRYPELPPAEAAQAAAPPPRRTTSTMAPVTTARR